MGVLRTIDCTFMSANAVPRCAGAPGWTFPV